MLTSEQKIGKKVWLLDGSLERGFKLKSKDTFTVVEVKSTKDCGDWAEHYVIRHDSDGKEIEVREFQVIFAIEENGEIMDYRIYRYLLDNQLYSEVYMDSEGTVSVDISWGDWKHEHLWCRDLMAYIGYFETEVVVTEDNDSDCYSATHYYKKVE